VYRSKIGIKDVYFSLLRKMLARWCLPVAAKYLQLVQEAAVLVQIWI